MVQYAFNAATVAPMEPGYPIWDGPVPVVIVKQETKPTSANNGSNMLILTVRAIGGEFQGQENAVYLNLWNVNDQAKDMAQRELSAIAHVTGRVAFQDTEQLSGVPFIIVWRKTQREVTDQKTGAKRTLDACSVSEYRHVDGRTIKEAMAGQPASHPYDPNVRSSGGNTGGVPAAPAPFQAPQPGQQPGFQPPQGQPQPTGYAPPSAAPAQAGGYAMAPGGAQQPQMAPGTPTAGFAGSPPGQPQYQPQPGQPQQYQPQPSQYQPQGQPGFQPPASPQPGAGPWGPGGQPQR